jgi:predicted lipid-binding transport protein (Tim44 family)
MLMPQSATARKKQPKTFSLAEDVIDVLESYRKKEELDSLTAALEQIVREWRKADLAAQVAAYYDTLSDEEIAKEERWGSFSESQM